MVFPAYQEAVFSIAYAIRQPLLSQQTDVLILFYKRVLYILCSIIELIQLCIIAIGSSAPVSCVENAGLCILQAVSLPLNAISTAGSVARIVAPILLGLYCITITLSFRFIYIFLKRGDDGIDVLRNILRFCLHLLSMYTCDFVLLSVSQFAGTGYTVYFYEDTQFSMSKAEKGVRITIGIIFMCVISVTCFLSDLLFDKLQVHYSRTSSSSSSGHSDLLPGRIVHGRAEVLIDICKCISCILFVISYSYYGNVKAMFAVRAVNVLVLLIPVAAQAFFCPLISARDNQVRSAVLSAAFGCSIASLAAAIDGLSNESSSTQDEINSMMHETTALSILLWGCIFAVIGWMIGAWRQNILNGAMSLDLNAATALVREEHLDDFDRILRLEVASLDVGVSKGSILDDATTLNKKKLTSTSALHLKSGKEKKESKRKKEYLSSKKLHDLTAEASSLHSLDQGRRGMETWGVLKNAEFAGGVRDPNEKYYYRDIDRDFEGRIKCKTENIIGKQMNLLEKNGKFVQTSSISSTPRSKTSSLRVDLFKGVEDQKNDNNNINIRVISNNAESLNDNNINGGNNNVHTSSQSWRHMRPPPIASPLSCSTPDHTHTSLSNRKQKNNNFWRGSLLGVPHADHVKLTMQYQQELLSQLNSPNNISGSETTAFPPTIKPIRGNSTDESNPQSQLLQQLQIQLAAGEAENQNSFGISTHIDTAHLNGYHSNLDGALDDPLLFIPATSMLGAYVSGVSFSALKRIFLFDSDFEVLWRGTVEKWHSLATSERIVARITITQQFLAMFAEGRRSGHLSGFLLIWFANVVRSFFGSQMFKGVAAVERIPGDTVNLMDPKDGRIKHHLVKDDHSSQKTTSNSIHDDQINEQNVEEDPLKVFNPFVAQQQHQNTLTNIIFSGLPCMEYAPAVAVSLANSSAEISRALDVRYACYCLLRDSAIESLLLDCDGDIGAQLSSTEVLTHGATSSTLSSQHLQGLRRLLLHGRRSLLEGVSKMSNLKEGIFGNVIKRIIRSSTFTITKTSSHSFSETPSQWDALKSSLSAKSKFAVGHEQQQDVYWRWTPSVLSMATQLFISASLMKANNADTGLSLQDSTSMKEKKLSLLKSISEEPTLGRFADHIVSTMGIESPRKKGERIALALKEKELKRKETARTVFLINQFLRMKQQQHHDELHESSDHQILDERGSQKESSSRNHRQRNSMYRKKMTDNEDNDDLQYRSRGEKITKSNQLEGKFQRQRKQNKFREEIYQYKEEEEEEEDSYTNTITSVISSSASLVSNSSSSFSDEIAVIHKGKNNLHTGYEKNRKVNREENSIRQGKENARIINQYQMSSKDLNSQSFSKNRISSKFQNKNNKYQLQNYNNEIKEHDEINGLGQNYNHKKTHGIQTKEKKRTRKILEKENSFMMIRLGTSCQTSSSSESRSSSFHCCHNEVSSNIGLSDFSFKSDHNVDVMYESVRKRKLLNEASIHLSSRNDFIASRSNYKTGNKIKKNFSTDYNIIDRNMVSVDDQGLEDDLNNQGSDIILYDGVNANDHVESSSSCYSSSSNSSLSDSEDADGDVKEEQDHFISDLDEELIGKDPVSIEDIRMLGKNLRQALSAFQECERVVISAQRQLDKTRNNTVEGAKRITHLMRMYAKKRIEFLSNFLYLSKSKLNADDINLNDRTDDDDDNDNDNEETTKSPRKQRRNNKLSLKEVDKSQNFPNRKTNITFGSSHSQNAPSKINSPMIELENHSQSIQHQLLKSLQTAKSRAIFFLQSILLVTFLTIFILLLIVPFSSTSARELAIDSAQLLSHMNILQESLLSTCSAVRRSSLGLDFLDSTVLTPISTPLETQMGNYLSLQANSSTAWDSSSSTLISTFVTWATSACTDILQDVTTSFDESDRSNTICYVGLKESFGSSSSTSNNLKGLVSVALNGRTSTVSVSSYDSSTTDGASYIATWTSSNSVWVTSILQPVTTTSTSMRFSDWIDYSNTTSHPVYPIDSTTVVDLQSPIMQYLPGGGSGQITRLLNTIRVAGALRYSNAYTDGFISLETGSIASDRMFGRVLDSLTALTVGMKRAMTAVINGLSDVIQNHGEDEDIRRAINILTVDMYSLPTYSSASLSRQETSATFQNAVYAFTSSVNSLYSQIDTSLNMTALTSSSAYFRQATDFCVSDVAIGQAALPVASVTEYARKRLSNVGDYYYGFLLSAILLAVLGCILALWVVMKHLAEFNFLPPFASNFQSKMSDKSSSLSYLSSNAHESSSGLNNTNLKNQHDSRVDNSKTNISRKGSEYSRIESYLRQDILIAILRFSKAVPLLSFSSKFVFIDNQNLINSFDQGKTIWHLRKVSNKYLSFSTKIYHSHHHSQNNKEKSDNVINNDENRLIKLSGDVILPDDLKKSFERGKWKSAIRSISLLLINASTFLFNLPRSPYINVIIKHKKDERRESKLQADNYLSSNQKFFSQSLLSSPAKLRNTLVSRESKRESMIHHLTSNSLKKNQQKQNSLSVPPTSEDIYIHSSSSPSSSSLGMKKKPFMMNELKGGPRNDDVRYNKNNKNATHIEHLQNILLADENNNIWNEIGLKTPVSSHYSNDEDISPTPFNNSDGFKLPPHSSQSLFSNPNPVDDLSISLHPTSLQQAPIGYGHRSSLNSQDMASNSFNILFLNEDSNFHSSTLLSNKNTHAQQQQYFNGLTTQSQLMKGAEAAAKNYYRGNPTISVYDDGNFLTSPSLLEKFAATSAPSPSSLDILIDDDLQESMDIPSSRRSFIYLMFGCISSLLLLSFGILIVYLIITLCVSISLWNNPDKYLGSFDAIENLITTSINISQMCSLTVDLIPDEVLSWRVKTLESIQAVFSNSLTNATAAFGTLAASGIISKFSSQVSSEIGLEGLQILLRSPSICLLTSESSASIYDSTLCSNSSRVDWTIPGAYTSYDDFQKGLFVSTNSLYTAAKELYSLTTSSSSSSSGELLLSDIDLNAESADLWTLCNAWSTDISSGLEKLKDSYISAMSVDYNESDHSTVMVLCYIGAFCLCMAVGVGSSLYVCWKAQDEVDKIVFLLRLLQPDLGLRHFNHLLRKVFGFNIESGSKGNHLTNEALR